MRLFVSASILSITCGSIQSSANAENALETKVEVTRQIDAAYNTPTNTSGQRFLGQECQLPTEADPDVGILGCRNPKAICNEDEISSLGGRCALDRTQLTPKINQPIFYNRRPLPQSERETAIPRFLQNDSWSCPTNCPKAFCKCAQKYGEVKHCTKEMDDLCIDGLVSECVPDSYLPFYYQTYCPFSECIVANNSYEDCSCQYYRDYCTLYYAFDQSTEKCNIAACCEAAGNVDDKMMCLPGIQPTASPTMRPTESNQPSAAPSDTMAPTVTMAPSGSPKPTTSPTVSSAPTVTSAPTSVPSGTPSIAPTISFAPTTPSDNPSISPSTSTAPSTTSSPTDKPTNSFLPTISTAPSVAPTLSIIPSVAPTGTPTVSFSPSEEPSTASPTYKPTKKPSRRPTRKPTQRPTRSPTTENPTETVVAESESIENASVAKSTMITSLLGMAGAAWFLMW